jgi:NitT/TauT family transport system permease protein
MRPEALRAAGWRLAPLIGLLLAWELAVRWGLFDSAFLPAVHTIAAALWDLARGGELWLNLLVSVWRSLAGLVLGSAAGVLLGLAMARSPVANRLFGPLVATTYSLPKAALVPLFLLWFGIGDLTDILTVFLACLLPVVVSTYHGARAVPQVLLWSAEAMGTAALPLLWRVVLPAASLQILTGVRIALGFSWVLTLSAEMIAARTGMGKLIFLYGESGAYDYMFAGILAVLVLAYLADRGMVRLMHGLLHWSDAHRPEAA